MCICLFFCFSIWLKIYCFQNALLSALFSGDLWKGFMKLTIWPILWARIPQPRRIHFGHNGKKYAPCWTQCLHFDPDMVDISHEKGQTVVNLTMKITLKEGVPEFLSKITPPHDRGKTTRHKRAVVMCVSFSMPDSKTCIGTIQWLPCQVKSPKPVIPLWYHCGQGLVFCVCTGTSLILVWFQPRPSLIVLWNLVWHHSGSTLVQI